jgi:hypothetical protein
MTKNDFILATVSRAIAYNYGDNIYLEDLIQVVSSVADTLDAEDYFNFKRQ